MNLDKTFYARCWSAVALFFALVPATIAFVLHGVSWSNDTAHYYLESSGSQFDAAFIEAMRKWNGRSNFSFTSSASGAFDPCVSNPDNKNSYRFSTNNCGRGWNSSTLAVTTTWSSGSNTIDTDIVFNSQNHNWGVFDGSSSSAVDFRRVAVHELGHALGLGHEPTASTNSAIMKPFISNIVDPQPDDINGMRAIYGGTGGGGGGGNDFFVQNSTLSPSAVTPGSALTARTEQHYVGSSTSTLTPRVGYYLSSNTSLGASDKLLGNDLSDLSIGDTQDNESDSIRIPASTAPGQYYILFVADHDQDYTEINENNNIQAVSLTVNATQRRLSVSVSGAGRVRSSPAGISCPSDCSQSYRLGRVISLSANPSAGWKFKRWSGACSGAGSCVVSMSANRSIGAVFEKTVVITPMLLLLLLND